MWFHETQQTNLATIPNNFQDATGIKSTEDHKLLTR